MYTSVSIKALYVMLKKHQKGFHSNFLILMHRQNQSQENCRLLYSYIATGAGKGDCDVKGNFPNPT